MDLARLPLPEPRSREVCPVCRVHADHVRATGEVGCPLCYDVHSAIIRAILDRKARASGDDD